MTITNVATPTCAVMPARQPTPVAALGSGTGAGVGSNAVVVAATPGQPLTPKHGAVLVVTFAIVHADSSWTSVTEGIHTRIYCAQRSKQTLVGSQVVVDKPNWPPPTRQLNLYINAWHVSLFWKPDCESDLL